jgi:hypothetical protein
MAESPGTAAQDLMRASLMPSEVQQPVQEEAASAVDAVAPLMQGWQTAFTPWDMNGRSRVH